MEAYLQIPNQEKGPAHDAEQPLIALTESDKGRRSLAAVSESWGVASEQGPPVAVSGKCVSEDACDGYEDMDMDNVALAASSYLPEHRAQLVLDNSLLDRPRFALKQGKLSRRLQGAMARDAMSSAGETSTKKSWRNYQTRMELAKSNPFSHDKKETLKRSLQDGDGASQNLVVLSSGPVAQNFTGPCKSWCNDKCKNLDMENPCLDCGGCPLDRGCNRDNCDGTVVDEATGEETDIDEVLDYESFGAGDESTVSTTTTMSPEEAML
jgi:hypothetical protein